jgi:gliding motility-associated-like protein
MNNLSPKYFFYTLKFPWILLKNIKSNSVFIFMFFMSIGAFAQGPGCPNVNAGPDVELDCGDPCTDLNATFLETGETTSYEISSIPYDPPFPATGGTPVSVNTDDVWSPVIPIPFDFCFYGVSYNEMLIGSNGVITFDLVNNTPSGYCAWSFDESIPDANLFLTTIFGPYMDIDPSVGGSGQINYTVFGDAPCRTMVVNFPDIPYFSCNSLSMTTQIVIYETTNVVEVYLEDRSDQCPNWNSGNAVIGVQNQTGTDGFTPPGRNTGNWAASLEAWRFTPNGPSNVEFSWLDSNGDVIGTDPAINVCPVDQTTVYTAQAIYTNCNGDIITETDDVTVTKVTSFTVELGGDQELCDVASYVITAEIINGDPATATFLWSTGETTQSITVTTSGDYSVDVTIDSCTITETVNIQFGLTPDIDLGPDIDTCFEDQVILDASPANIDPAEVTYEWSLDTVVLPGETNPTLTVTQYGLYSVVVTHFSCVNTDAVTVGPSSDLGVELGEDFETCFDDVVILDASPTSIDPALATYVWSLDGTVISGADSNTLEVTENGTYDVVVTFGECADQDTIVVSGRDDLVVNVGVDVTLCPNQDYTITATTDEVGVTYSWTFEGQEVGTDSTLDLPLAAQVDGIVPGDYEITITIGDCTGSDSIYIDLYDLDRCVIPQGISPNGDNLNDSFDLEFISDRTGINKLQIFNRFGSLVYERNNYVNEWSGLSDDGDELPTGTYYYVLDLLGEDAEFGRQVTGWVYINREAN